MQTNQETQATDKSTEKLREYLRSELSAKETYELALKSVTHVGLHQTMQEIYVSHSRRAELLSERIGRSSEPQTTSGIWGAVAKAIQAGADLLGDRTMIAALESGEDRGVELYARAVDDCDAKTQKILADDLKPEQQRTHDLCRSLKQYMQAPS